VITENSSTSLAQEQTLEAETFIESYKTIAEWIRFADAKAGVTLTVNGILLGLILPMLKTYLNEKETIHPTTWWTSLVTALFLCWLLFLVLSAICSFLCILPIRGAMRQLVMSQTTHFHPAAVSQQYRLADFERFIGDFDKISMTGFKREIIAAILIDSHLSSAKYTFVTRAIRCLAFSVIFGFFFLIASQF
jgi:hypothetical protein